MPLSNWLPQPPWRGPPLPRWLVRNPGTWKAWTSPEQYTRVAEKAGDWATARSASMLSKADIMAGKLDIMSEKMYDRMMSRLSMVPAPPIVAPPKVKKVPVKKVPKVEVVPPPVVLKKARAADVEELIRVASDWRREKGRFPDIVEIEDIAKEKGFKVSDAQVGRIGRVLQGEKPMTLEELKPGVLEWVKVARAPGEWPSIDEIQTYVRLGYFGFKLSDKVAKEWLLEAKGG